MSILDNSSQKIGNNNQAIQVAGDLNIGNTTTEVIAICNMVIESQMASLRQVAQEEARSRALEFGNQIIEKLSSEMNEVVMKKLSDPDIQYTMHQSVVQVARKGLGAKSDLLKELIVSKIKNNAEERDLLIDHALDITPRLTTSELKLISIIYYLRFCRRFSNGININDVLYDPDENYSLNGINKSTAKSIWTKAYQDPSLDFDKITDDIDTIIGIDLPMLSVKGCTNAGQIYTQKYLTIFNERTNIELKDDSEFSEKYPILKNLLDRFGVKNLEELDSTVLSQLGIIIAENYLTARGVISYV